MYFGNISYQLLKLYGNFFGALLLLRIGLQEESKEEKPLKYRNPSHKKHKKIKNKKWKSPIIKNINKTLASTSLTLVVEDSTIRSAESQVSAFLLLPPSPLPSLVSFLILTSQTPSNSNSTFFFFFWFSSAFLSK